MQFYDYPEEHWGNLLPRVSEEGQDLVSELVRYESGARTTALKVNSSMTSPRIASLTRTGPRTRVLSRLAERAPDAVNERNFNTYIDIDPILDWV